MPGKTKKKPQKWLEGQWMLQWKVAVVIFDVYTPEVLHVYTVIFYGFYHGKSPFCTTIWGILFTFCKNLKQIQVKFNMVHLKISPWKWRFRNCFTIIFTFQPLNFGGVPGMKKHPRKAGEKVWNAEGISNIFVKEIANISDRTGCCDSWKNPTLLKNSLKPRAHLWIRLNSNLCDEWWPRLEEPWWRIVSTPPQKKKQRGLSQGIPSGIIKLPIWGGDQTIQMYGKFEGFPFNGALFGLVISCNIWFLQGLEMSKKQHKWCRSMTVGEKKRADLLGVTGYSCTTWFHWRLLQKCIM